MFRPLLSSEGLFLWHNAFVKRIFFCLILVLSALTQIRARELSKAAGIFQKAEKAVVTVISGGHGSGFLVDEAGLVLTNSHVVTGNKYLTVRFGQNQTVEAKVLVNDRENDIAVLWVSLENIQSYEILKLSEAEPLVMIGEKVIAIGSPVQWETMEKTMTLGVVGKKSEKVISHDASLNGGNSGGPLLNYDGEVVGINTFVVSSKGPAIGNAVTIDLARASLTEAKNRMTETPHPVAKLKQEVSEKLFPYKDLSFQNLKKDPRPKDYVIKSKYFTLNTSTPTMAYRELVRYDDEMLKKRKKRAEKNDYEVTDDEYRSKNVSSYASISFSKPVVTAIVVPKPKITKASALKKGLGLGLDITSAVFTGFAPGASAWMGNNLEIKRDFSDLELLDAEENIVCEPIRRSRVDLSDEVINLYSLSIRKFRDKFFVGYFEYDPSCFNTDKELYFRVITEGEELKNPLINIKSKLHSTIKSDFKLWY